MPTSHDDLLTPTGHEAAQFLVTLAWRLDGGQLVGADQLLARLCAIPTNDIAVVSIVLLQKVAHSVAPCSSGRRSSSWTTSAPGSPAEVAHPASSVWSEIQAAACRSSSARPDSS